MRATNAGVALFIVLFGGTNALHATLVLVSGTPVSGSGIGAQNTILTIQNNGSEAGCVSLGGDPLGDVLGSSFGAAECIGSSADVKTGASQTQTRTLADIGVTSASEFGIVFNAVEPAAGPITLDDLVVRFYDPSGAVLFTSSGVSCPDLGGACLFPSTGSGTGTSGFLFVLDTDQQTSATTAGAFANPLNVIGLSAALSGSSGGNETFYLASLQDAGVATPEPSTAVMLALGLAGVMFGSLRKRSG